MADIPLKRSDEIARMRDLGGILARIFDDIREFVVVGVSTKYVEMKAEEFMKKYKVQSAFKGYRGYPGSICVSVNDEIIHGIPREDKIVAAGDVVGIDMGIFKDSLYVDAARTYVIGIPENRVKHLVETTEKALFDGIQHFKANNRLGDISAAIEKTVTAQGFSVVKEFVGHGIGKNLHEEPAIPNYGTPHEGALLKEGMVFAIEPMVNAGTDAVNILADGWTAVTADGSMSAHFEHTVALTKDGPAILTKV